MQKASQFKELSRNNAIKMIKSIIDILLEDTSLKEVQAQIDTMSELSDDLKMVVKRELESKELGSCSIENFLIGKYKMLHIASREEDNYITIVKLVIEIIGIKLFKTDVREYTTFDGKYNEAKFLFDQISLNYKKADLVPHYLEAVRQTVLAEVESHGEAVHEGIYTLICDLIDLDYWHNEFNNMVIREVGDFKVKEDFRIGTEINISSDIDFSRRHSINPVMTYVDVYGNSMKFKEAVIHNMHFIIAGTDYETVVINTRYTDYIKVYDATIFGVVLQYYKLKDFGLEYKLTSKDDSKVTRINRKAKSREEMLAIQDKWNFKITENETLARKYLLD